MKKYTLQAFVAAFALLISTTAVTAYAQVPPITGFEQVEGTYSNSDAGVTITFPSGWSGGSFGNENSTIVIVAPGALGEASEKAMMLVLVDKTEVEGDPTDPASYTEDAPDCTIPTPTETTVSSKRGFELEMECVDDKGTIIKLKMTVAETSDSWIMVMYTSPLQLYFADVVKYDAAVDTLQIQGAVDATLPAMPSEDDGTDDDEMKSNTMSVTVGENSIDVSVQSSSTISAFKLDEATKTVSFMADGSGDKTVVTVGKVLEGPYTVMVDGTATTDFEETTSADGVKTITVPHDSGAHTVTITGTQVVPEFPVAILAIVAALIALVTVVGRTKLLKM